MVEGISVSTDTQAGWKPAPQEELLKYVNTCNVEGPWSTSPTSPTDPDGLQVAPGGSEKPRGPARNSGLMLTPQREPEPRITPSPLSNPWSTGKPRSIPKPAGCGNLPRLQPPPHAETRVNPSAVNQGPRRKPPSRKPGRVVNAPVITPSRQDVNPSDLNRGSSRESPPGGKLSSH